MLLKLMAGAASSAVPVRTLPGSTLLGRTLTGLNVDDPLPDVARR